MNLAKWLVLLAFIAGPVSVHATESSASAGKCSYDRGAMLALDENAFDQDLSNGGGGWRKIDNIPGCQLAAADLIAAYRQKHGLEKPIYYWHEGQVRASIDEQTERAIGLLAAAHRKEPEQEAWNAYVDATLAFLRRDKPALLAAREALLQAPVPGRFGALKDGYVEVKFESGETMKMRWPMNIDVVEGLIACFDKPYDEVYGSSTCRPKP